MTASEISPAAITHGFDFARRQRDPEFRRYLTKIGWRPDHDIVIARDEEPVLAVLARIVYNETSSPCLIVIPNDKEAFGFRFLFAAVEPPRKSWRRRRATRCVQVKITLEASIGMLYSTLEPCGTYVPSEWTRPVLFERGTA